MLLSIPPHQSKDFLAGISAGKSDATPAKKSQDPVSSCDSKCLHRCWQDDQQRAQGDRCLIGCWSCKDEK